MTTPDYILRFAEAIAPGNAELLLTGGTEEAILNAATDTISDLRERNAELAAQRLELDDRAYYEGRIAELEAALRAFAPNNIKPGHWALADQNTDDPHEWCCKHCKARAGEWQDIEHAPDCPVTLARAVLDKEA